MTRDYATLADKLPRGRPALRAIVGPVALALAFWVFYVAAEHVVQLHYAKAELLEQVGRLEKQAALRKADAEREQCSVFTEKKSGVRYRWCRLRVAGDS